MAALVGLTAAAKIIEHTAFQEEWQPGDAVYETQAAGEITIPKSIMCDISILLLFRANFNHLKLTEKSCMMDHLISMGGI